MPSISLAAVNNSPKEPTSNVPIALGEVFAGTNCTLKTDGDVDSFVFNGSKGETYQIALAINDPSAASTDICLTLYSPSEVQIFSGCTVNDYPDYETWSVVIDQTLTATGTYTMDVTEASSATTNYAVSVQRLFPFPQDAQPVPKLDQSVAGNIVAPTASNAFIFTGATTGKYEVSATVPASSQTPNLCMIVYTPGGTMVGTGAVCTVNDYPDYEIWTAVIDFTPPQDGTYMAFLYVEGNDTTVPYSLEVSCLVGNCPVPLVPVTACTDALSYDSTTSTLTMDFTIGTPIAVIWDAWLVSANTAHFSGNTTHPLWSVSQPITEPETSVTKTEGVARVGRVGVLSIFTTPTEGITCSSWVTINTGGS